MQAERPDRLAIVFAKAPMPGQVKTRLIPALGAEGAAMLHAALTERTVATAKRSRARVELCVSPDVHHSFFDDCRETYGIALHAQGEGALGERMLRALERGLAIHREVVIVGADCPAVTPVHLDAAFAALATHDIALYPARDGGYVAIAARRVHPAMFDGIAWGGSDVYSRQRAVLRECGLSCAALETLWDVDRPEDLPLLSALRPPLAYALPDV